MQLIRSVLAYIALLAAILALLPGMAGLGAGYGVHSEAMLLESKAVAVKYTFSQLLEWLLDGRIEKAYA